ncbi:MAG: serine hydrolase domain-containing protein [Candidatus Dormibacteria bacterium]
MINTQEAHMASTVLDPSALKTELEAKVREAAERHNVPGVAVGILSEGRETYVYHGVTSVENPLPVDEHTMFQIGSTGKTFTATAMMRLVEQGKVDLDAPVRKYVPELQLKDEDTAATVTVRQLLNHTAGWQGDVFENVGDGDDCLEKYVAHMATLEQVSPLGSTFSYNNAAVALAGRVIEKVTGQVFEAAMTDLVLKPLGLKESLYSPTEIMTRRFAAGHTNREGEIEVSRPWAMPRSVNPMGGLSSTAKDQVRYARFHLGDGRTPEGERVLSQESLDLMKTPTVAIPAGTPGNHVGLSWLIRDIDGKRLVGHGGATVGQLSAFQTVPEVGFVITILTNSSPKGAELYKELMEWALEAYVGIVEPADPEPLELSPAELAEYAGVYATEASMVMVTVDGDHLVVNSEVIPEEWAKISNDPAPVSPPTNVRLLPGDLGMVTDGPSKGGKFLFVREGGKITGVNMGRLAKRRES